MIHVTSALSSDLAWLESRRYADFEAMDLAEHKTIYLDGLRIVEADEIAHWFPFDEVEILARAA